MWIVGSLWSAGLYGGLATNRYGTAYAYLFFAACLSAIAGILAWSDTVAWAGVLFAGLALAIQLVDDRAGRTALAHLTRPLLLPARVLVAVALVVGSSIALAVGLGVPAGGDRFALSALGVVGLAYYVVRARLEIGWERWLAVAGPAAVAEGLVFAFGAPLQTYGFAAGILAVCYALAGELGDLAGQPTPLAGWVRIRAVPIAYVAVGGALVPFAAYWRAPALGALVWLWPAAAFAAVAASSAVRWLDPPEATRPVAAALAALVIFVPAYLPHFRADPFARVAREIAVSVAGVGVISGLAFAFARSFGAASLLPWDTGVWWATVPVVSAFGAIAVAEALHRRSPSLGLAAPVSFL